MPTVQELSQALKALNHKPIAYYKCYAKIMGSIAGGVALSQLMFHYACAEGNIFAKKDEALRGETGLSLREMREAKLRLKALPFLFIEARGIPPVTFYRIDEEVLWHTLGTFPNLNEGGQIKKNEGGQNIKRESKKEGFSSIVSVVENGYAAENVVDYSDGLFPKERNLTSDEGIDYVGGLFPEGTPGEGEVAKGREVLVEEDTVPTLATSSSQEGPPEKKELVIEKDVAIEILRTVVAGIPLEDSRNAKSFHHGIFDALVSQGWLCQKEYWVKDRGDGKRGRIDIVVTAPLPMAIEIDRKAPRKKSVVKIDAFPGVRVVILRSSEDIDSYPGCDAVLAYPALCPGYTYAASGRRVNTPAAQTVLDHLNLIAQREYRVVGEIQKRLNEGATVDECKLMIDYLAATRTPAWKRDWFNHTTPFWRDNFDRNLASAKAWRPEIPEPTLAPAQGGDATDVFQASNADALGFFTQPRRSDYAS